MKTGPLEAENTSSEVTRDHMPASVATDLLCTQTHITNRERKTYQAARCTVFESTLLPLPIEEQLNRRLQKASWAQLAKWNKRCVSRRADAQRAYLLAERRQKVLQEKYESAEGREIPIFRLAVAQFDRIMSACSLKAEQLELFRDAIEQEVERRQDNIQKNLQEDPCKGGALKPFSNFKPAAECPEDTKYGN